MESRSDALVALIGEPDMADPQMTVLHGLTQAMNTLKAKYPDIKFHQRIAVLPTTQCYLAPLLPYKQLEPGIDEEILNSGQTYCVQFRMTKRLYSDKYDTSYLSLYSFPSLEAYKKHLSVAQKLCTVKYNDTFPPSQL